MKTIRNIPGKLRGIIYNEEIYRIHKAEGKERSSGSRPVRSNDVLVVADEENVRSELLNKILASVSLSQDTVDISPQLDSENNPYRKILVFTSENEFEKYTTHKIEGKMFLYADPLSSISENVELKKKLWAALKVLFLG